MSQFKRRNARSPACSTTVAPPCSRGAFSALHRLLNGGFAQSAGFCRVLISWAGSGQPNARLVCILVYLMYARHLLIVVSFWHACR
jgi:hypothetical protein